MTTPEPGWYKATFVGFDGEAYRFRIVGESDLFTVENLDRRDGGAIKPHDKVHLRISPTPGVLPSLWKVK